jgi:hypothetical protein
MPFGLTIDPGERDERAAREPALVADLQAALARWEREVEDGVPTSKAR